MEQDLPPEELEDWAEKLKRAFESKDAHGGIGAGEPAVVTGPDGLSHYRPKELWEEITYLGYHLHWDLATLLDLEHRDRRGLVRQVANLNEQAWEEVRKRG